MILSDQTCQCIADSEAENTDMSNVALIQPERVPVTKDETAAIIHMIERAARDPSVDIDKMERLIALQEKMYQRAAEEAFSVAMSAAQTEMRPVAADATNPQTRSKYASYVALDKALRPIYSRHGFALSFDEGDCQRENYVRVLCYVSRGGYTRTYRADIPADGKGAKGGDVMTKTHATGAAYTYGQRYLLKMIFNIAVGEDDDGNAAGDASDKIDQQQLEWLQTLIVEVGADIPKFCKYLKVARLEDLPASKYPQAVDALNNKRNAAKEAKP